MSTNPIVPPTSPPERPPFGPAWRVGLAVALVVTLALLLALWPFLSALGAALVPWGATIAGILVIGGVLLLIGGIGVMYALALHRIGSAWQAYFVTLPNGMPAALRDVSARRRTHKDDGLIAQLLAQSMADHAAQLLAEKQRPLPLVTSYHQAITHAPQLQQIEDVTPHVPGLSAESEWLAWTDNTPHLMIAGRTDSGKTTTVEAILARRILAGDLVLVVDPHYQAGKWLGSMSVGGGRDYAACYQVFDAARALLDRRYASFNAGTRTEDFRRISLVVDEVPAIIAHAQMGNKTLYERWLLFATSLGSEARKVRISVILSTQTPLVRDIGISSAMRENFARIALGDTAADLLRDEPNAARKQALLELLRGRPYPAAMEYRNNWYALRNDDIRRLAQTNGVTPRVPSLLLPTPQITGTPQREITVGLPATQRVYRHAAPPTDPLPPLTVQAEILLLLGSQNAWLTASEIASKLGTDLGVIRTEIDALYNNKTNQLVRRSVRGKRTKEKYEYQIAQPFQSVQPTITPSA